MMTCWSKRFYHSLMATVIAVVWLLVSASVCSGYSIDFDPVPEANQSVVGHREHICQRVVINVYLDFNQLKGCTVIEGSLQIHTIFDYDTKTQAYAKLSFPELREITGYLMVFYSDHLVSMKNLFPNLAVIRGQELVESYSLLVFKVPHMQEIGLPALTDIQSGGVWIVDNENLCYVDTIDWRRIANDSNVDGIFKNKQQCPNTCPQCPKSELESDKNLCWSKDHCQVSPWITCSHCNGRLCTKDNQCCHKECLGGCSGPGQNECHVCKHVVVKSEDPEEGLICSDKCPDGYYEYLHRRCVTATECHNISTVAHSNHPTNPGGTLTGKWYNNTSDGNRQMCVLECPKNTVLDPEGKACIPCGGTCKKKCGGRVVDSIEKARELAGCTRITGALKIHIRRSSTAASGALVKELRDSLDKIEEIDDFLTVSSTNSIYSLDFLASLRIIRGYKLEDKKYALIVKSNDNLMELWNGTDSVKRRITIENKDAHVLFHYNPQLCPSKIEEFVNQAGIKRPDANIDVGITNGDKAPCNTKTLTVKVLQRSNSTVNIIWENFRRNLTATNFLLNYEIHYKEAKGYPRRKESKFDRDPCGNDGWNVQEKAKISDNEVGGVEKEPKWENEAIIAFLKPYTYYALYVKAIVIPDNTWSLNNNTGAESDIIYIRTYADKPSPPLKFRLASIESDSITASWSLPVTANGDLKSFKIWLKTVPESQSLQDQRDYCVHGRSPLVTKSAARTVDSFISSTFSPILEKSKDPDCCSCSATAPPQSKKQITDNILYEATLLDVVMNRAIVSNSNSKAPGNGNSSSGKGPADDDNPESNEIKKSRRRRWAAKDDQQNSASHEVLDKESLFPTDTQEELHNLDFDSFITQKEGFEFVQDVPYNPNSTETFYSISLKKLTHYTTYYVGIEACRAVDTDIGSFDDRTCSDMIAEQILTEPLPSADEIDAKTISFNVTGSNRLQIRWNEPERPNGVVMAYTVYIQKVGPGKDEFWDKKCITHKDFQRNGKSFNYTNPLSTGNYSIRIQVASLARDSEHSAAQYFYIEDLGETSTGFWILVILLPFMLIVLATGGFTYLVVKRHYSPGHLVISANPEYMPNVDIAEEWEVPRDKIKLLSALGNGSFGTVYEGKLVDFIPTQPDVRCAVKTVTEDTPSDERILFLKEAALMTKLSCNHVVKLLGIVSKSQPIYVIMEMMVNGDLKQYLRSRRPDTDKKDGLPPPTLKQILRIASEIADGMAYIHSQRLVHRDLAARNCLVHESLTVKVGDFGMTKEITDYYRKQTRGLLPVRWMAPESLHDGVFTTHSDVWSFGVVLWEMATLAAQPYQGLSNSQVLDFVQSGRVMEMPEKCPQILCDLMAECWHFNSRCRPTFINILERLNPYLESSFAQVSFYHSPEGLEYRSQASQRAAEEEPITVRTPLIATFEVFDDDDLDYETDEDNPLNHTIIDDLEDLSSKRLLGSTPVKPTIESSSSPSSTTTTPVENGVALTPLSNSGNTSFYAHLNNGASSRSPQSTSQPSSLFTNPPLLTSASALSPLRSNNNYTEVFSPTTETSSYAKPTSNSIPLTPVKVNNDVNSSKNKAKPTSRSPVTYTPVTPVSQTTMADPKKVDGTNSPTGVYSKDDSSKAFGVNCSGDSHKFGNGNNAGGNGYILPLTGNQPRNQTTPF